MGDQCAPVPAVQRITGRLVPDQRAAIRMAGIDRPQVQRNGWCRGWTDNERRAVPARDNRPVEVAAHDRLDLIVAACSLGKPRDPWLGGIGIHPVDARHEGRVMHGDHGRYVLVRLQLRAEPGCALCAKCAAMTAGLGRIEQQQAQAISRDGVLDEAAILWRVRKGRKQRGAVVVVADHRPDRKRTVAHGFRQPGEAFAVTRFGQVAGHQQQVGAVGTVRQAIQ